MELLLRQLAAHGLAGRQHIVVRGLAAGDAVAHPVDARVVAVLLPAAHPLAIAPAEGAEQAHGLAAHLVLDAVEHGLELHLLQHLTAHGGAAHGHGGHAGKAGGSHLVRGQQGGIGSGGLHALQHRARHGLGVAGAAPIDHESLFHSCTSFLDITTEYFVRPPPPAAPAAGRSATGRSSAGCSGGTGQTGPGPAAGRRTPSTGPRT